MDPTLVTGSIYTSKGGQNHILSQMWIDTVKKEQKIANRWRNSYEKTRLEEEKVLVDSLIEQQRKKRLESAAKPNTLGRKELLKLHALQGYASGSSVPRSSSQEYGWRYRGAVEDNEKTEYGHKPVITSSFFRRNGVF